MARAADGHGEAGGHGPVHHFAGLWSRGGLVTAPTPAEVESEWWHDTADVRTAIDELPFIRSLADGTLERSAFLGYLAQDAVYLRDYARVLAEASRLAPDAAAQAFWAESARGAIEGELELHRGELAAADAGLAARAADRVTTGYLDHLLAAAARGEYPVLVAALLPCFWIYTDLGARLGAGGFGEYPRSAEHPYASWLATYRDPAFAIATRRAIEIATDAASRATPEVRDRAAGAFRRSAEYELAFFAAPLARAGEPVEAVEVGAALGG